MIWLSPMLGTAEGSVYFDIRDIRLQQTGNGSEAVVSGLLGDGQREIWGEVQFGSDPQVRLLPQWTEDGQIEELNESIDEDLLKQQLFDAVARAFTTVRGWAAAPRTQHDFSSLWKCSQPCGRLVAA